MANENKEIGDIVKKCKILLLDIEGTTTSISFVKEKLFPYAEENLKQFLDSKWEQDEVKEAVGALRKLALEDQEGKVEGAVAIPGEDVSKEDQIEGLVANVKWQMSSDRKVGALKQLQGLIWKQGYDKGDIKGHVFDDVSAALQQWRSTDGQKVYIYSSGSVQAQKLLFGQSMAGDLLKYIDGHFDTAVGAKQETASYTNIVEKIGCKADEILFLTDIVKEAEAARGAGVNAALVSREGNSPLPDEAAAAFPVLRSMAELTVSNKRKPEHQDDIPAKIAKTETDGDVKSSASEETSEKPAVKDEDTEKMDVEEAVTNTEEKKEVKLDEPNVLVKELTDSNEAKDLPACDVEPVVEEKTGEKETKTELKLTEEKSEVETKPVEGENGEATPDEEKATTIITEIEDISDKPDVEAAEVVKDIEPVVEEPSSSEEMEVLQNVGEVLEKECDEILSKVEDVTNLENIPLKPMLNSIAEETMETDNMDTSDIVDGILDSELELEMKQRADSDLNTVAEVSDEVKTKGIEENGTTEKKDAGSENKTTDNNVEANCETAVKDKESSPKEKQTNDNKMQEEDKKESPVDVSPATEAETPAISKDNDVAADEHIKPVAEDVKSVSEEKQAVEESKPVADEPKPVAEEPKPVETKPVTEEIKQVTGEVKPATAEVKSATEETKSAEEVKSPAEESKPANDVTEPKVNGKATNGDTEKVKQNGDNSKEEELSSRLSVESGKEVANGKEAMNRSNGDAMKPEQGQGESKVDADIPDIKVKTLATDEPRTDPIEQPTEA